MNGSDIAEGGVIETTAIPVDFETRAGDDQHQTLRLWLRLLTCTTLVEREVRSRLRVEFSTTPPRFELMAHLDRAPDGLRMGTLSKRMMVTGGNVTGITDQLAVDGLVQRDHSPEDRRSCVLRLTPEGRRSFRRMQQAYEQWIDELVGTLSEREREQLYRLLGIFKHELHERPSV